MVNIPLRFLVFLFVFRSLVNGHYANFISSYFIFFSGFVDMVTMSLLYQIILLFSAWFAGMVTMTLLFPVILFSPWFGDMVTMPLLFIVILFFSLFR